MENRNFASSKLGSVICYDVVSDEEFPCHNLLKDSEKGFMVEYFIRLLVGITVLFSKKFMPVFNAGLKVRIIAQQAALEKSF